MMAHVELIYLPPGEEGNKQGVDDYLAAGHTVEDLLSLATTELRAQPSQGNSKPKQSETLVGYADDADLFRTSDGEAFAAFEVDGHKETWALKSERIRQWLLRRYYVGRGKPPSTQGLSEALATITAMAMFGGPERSVHIRVAKYEEHAMYLDLGNERWEAVEITVSGWKVVSSDQMPVTFVRKDNADGLTYPVSGGNIESLRRLLNVRNEEDFRLIVAWLIGAFNPEGPYPLLVLQGEQGSAKSTTVRVLRSVVDPAVGPSRAPPRNERDLAIAASGHWTPAFDNLSGVGSRLTDPRYGPLRQRIESAHAAVEAAAVEARRRVRLDEGR